MVSPRRTRVEATGERAAVTPLELFFDLVFVFALTQIDELMADHPSVVGIVRGVLLLAVMWWSWTGYAWLGNVARADEGAVRVAMFTAMGGVFVAAITIPEAFDDHPGGLDGPVVFACCYLAVRVVHLIMFLVVSRGDPRLRGQVVRFLPSMVVATALLFVASQTTGTAQTLLWLGALAGDYLGTLAAGTHWRLASTSHFAERHGAIVLVALGESVVATGIGIAPVPVSWPIVIGVLLGLAICAALWWAYFDVTALIAGAALARAEGDRRIRLARNGYSFLHLPMVIGVIMMALGLQKVLGDVGGADGHPPSAPLTGVPLDALYGGAALYLLAHVAFKRYVTGQLKAARPLTAVLLVALIPVMARVPALAALGVLAAVLIALVGWETHRFREQRHRLRHAEH